MRRTGASSVITGFPWILLLPLLLCPHERRLSSAFLPPLPSRTTTKRTKRVNGSKQCRQSPVAIPSRNHGRCLHYHPAVEGWEQKYLDAGGEKSSPTPSADGDEAGPRILSTEFEVHAATESELADLDVEHWPIWTTSDKEKWRVGNLVPDKEMPYGELSYVISGKLEIIPQSTGVPTIISGGDFVTFPKGFVASWKVLEELTWNYYLY